MLLAVDSYVTGMFYYSWAGSKLLWKKGIECNMEPYTPLRLDLSDERVRSALFAEEKLRKHYAVSGTDHFVRLEKYDINLRVCEYGEGEPLLIVPGNTGDSFVFMPLIAELAGFKIFALNRPGGGLSDGFDHRAADFRQLALDTLDTVTERFGLQNVPVIAHSMGAHWSLWHVGERHVPDRKIILLGVPGNVMECKPPFALRLASVPKLNSLLFQRITPKTADHALRGLKFMGHPERTLSLLPREMSECYFRFQHLPHYKISSLSLMEVTNNLSGSASDVHIDESYLQREIAQVKMLWGQNDPFGSVREGSKIASAWNADFEVVGSGHLPWLDEPKRCGKLITDFLHKV